MDALKNSMRSALNMLMSPVEETNEKTCQLALGPLQRFQVWPAIGIAVVICDPTGWMLGTYERDI